MKPFSVTVKIKTGPDTAHRELFRTEANTHEEAKDKALIHYGNKGLAFEIGLCRDLSERIAREDQDRDRETVRRLRLFVRLPDFHSAPEGYTESVPQYALEAACKAGRAEYDRNATQGQTRVRMEIPAHAAQKIRENPAAFIEYAKAHGFNIESVAFGQDAQGKAEQ